VEVIGISFSGIIMIGYAVDGIDERYKSFRSKITSFSDTQNNQIHLQKRPKVLTIAIIMMIYLSVEIFYNLILLLLGRWVSMRISFLGLLIWLLLELRTVYLSMDY
jgi:hypothetical protein